MGFDGPVRRCAIVTFSGMIFSRMVLRAYAFFIGAGSDP
jgi:hypothetical protein